MRVRALIGLAVVVATVGLLAGSASAHVTIDPPTAEQGSTTQLSFRVPNEESNADTAQLDMQFPTDHPIPSVSVQPKQGWTYQVMTQQLAEPIQTDNGPVTEAVSQITWKGGAIKPGEFDDFTVLIDSLPADADSVQFKAVQTYSNGDVVRWIDQSTPGGPEPEHPAPTLTLTKATTSNSAASTSGSDNTARTLGIIGIIVGVIGVAVAVIALATRRRPSAPPPAD
jgi:uncharacterized protein YcnI